MQSSGLAGQRWQQEMKNGIRRQEGQGDTQLGFRSTALTAALPGVCCHQGGESRAQCCLWLIHGCVPGDCHCLGEMSVDLGVVP